MKTCTHCQVSLPEADFRTRIDKRKISTCKYLNNTCKKCDSTLSKADYARKKSDPDYIQKNRARVKEWILKNHDRVKTSREERTASPEWKQYMNDWYKSHREQTRKLARNRNKKYAEEITPMYAKSRISFATWKFGIRLSHKDITDEMVEIKIKQLKSCRTQRELNS